MRDYELCLVVSPDLTSEKQEKLLEKLKKLVTDLKGKLEKTTEWGKKQFCYPIKKEDMGYYFLWEIQLPAEMVGKFDKELKLEEEVVRYLLVKRDTKKKGGPTSSRRNVGISRGK